MSQNGNAMEPRSSRQRLIVGGTIAILAAGGAWFALGGLGSGDGSDVLNRDDLVDDVVSLSSVEAPGPADVDDPARDGWDTELFHAATKEVLAQLGDLIKDPSQADEYPEGLEAVLANGFVCSALRPDPLETVFDGERIRVQRSSQSSLSSAASDAHAGTSGLREAMAKMSDRLGFLDDRHAALKIYRVEHSDGAWTTEAHLTAAGRKPEGHIQINATLHATWTWKSRESALLAKLTLADYEEVRVRTGAEGAFPDCTLAVMGAVPDFSNQFLRGAHSWWSQIETTVNSDPDAHHGLAIGDVNGDGLEDLYVCQGGGLPNRLLLRNPDGTVREAAQEAGVNWLDGSLGALLIDLDNDGDADLVVATSAAVLFARNDGKARFEVVQAVATTTPAHALTAADYDSDGFLDVYACVRFQGGTGRSNLSHSSYPVPYFDANNGGTNLLLRNQGGFRFQDVTRAVGLDANNTRWSFAASWEDYDDDGDPDLYVANDFGRNSLYRNDGGRFVDVAADAGVEDSASGMSASWGDFDRDGLMDIYVANMWSSAGGRVAYQRKFKDGDDDARPALQRFARGNSLFRNLGNGTFRDVSVDAGVTLGRWAWGSLFSDLNNDGWEDLVVTNGFITGPDPHDL